MVPMRAPHQPNPMQMKILSVPRGLGWWYLGDPDDYDEGNGDPLFYSDSSEYEARAIIKAEYIPIPVGLQWQLVKFLIDMEAEISALTQRDAKKLGVRPRR